MVIQNRQYNNKSIYVAAGDDIIVYFGNGTDTTSERYLNLGSTTMKLLIIGTAGFLITHFDGSILEYPKKCHADKQYNIKKMFGHIRSFKIHGLATSVIDVWGGM